jgi:hypothetical protein
MKLILIDKKLKGMSKKGKKKIKIKKYLIKKRRKNTKIICN